MSERIQLAILLVAISIPATALAADNYHCQKGNLERRVEIFYEPGRAVPCEVHYYKDTEAPGERQVLWRAQNESGYCESKTSAFIAQLESQGWDCSSSASEADSPAAEEPATAEPAEPDDTEDLAPANN
jgi:hypothetical protein